MMHDKDMVLAGLIGLGISAGLWLLSSWRLVFHTLMIRGRQDDEEQLRGGSPRLRFNRTIQWKWMTYRRIFHSLLW
jgi:hypothetical protein